VRLKKLFAKVQLFNPQFPEEHQYIRYKYDFLNSVYLFICCISFVMGVIRWYESPLLALITLGYSLSGFGLLYYLNCHKNQIELICTLVLIQSFILAVSLYLLNFPYTLRLSFFFLLLSTALFLKGRKEGFRWMIAILVAIYIGDLFFTDKIGYSHFDILVSSFSIVCLFYIVNSYEKVKEKQTEDLKALNLKLEYKVQERTNELKQANQLLEQEKSRLKKLSYTDQLTSLYNRYKIKELFDYEKKQIIRYKTELAIIIIDIDYFKTINDSYGHTVGDLILIELANLLQTIVRNSDVVSRWGGEEFVILAPKTNLEQARVLAEKIRHKIKSHHFSHDIHMTVSFGVTSFQENDTLERIILRADEALYKAKESGRDRVKVHTSDLLN
jgi:diguanylate cyclase (GGDEF)-like protein